MNFRSGMMCAIVAALALGGCAPAAAGGGGPVVSPTGKIYEPGLPPRETAQSRAATLAVATGRFDEAMTQAQVGMAADSLNPIHFYLGGEAAAGLGNYELADSLWRVAEEIYPAYEIDIEPSREGYWAKAFNEGIATYEAGNTAGTIEAWSKAHLIYNLRPVAAQNLAVLLAQDERYEEAIDVYQEGLASLSLMPATRPLDPMEQEERDESRIFMEDNLVQVLLITANWVEAEALLRDILTRRPDDVEVQANLAAVLAELDRDDEANAIYTRLLSVPNLGPSQLFSIGVSLFNAEQHLQAAEAFARVTQLVPNHRDAWFNQANALYAAEAWAELLPVGNRLVQVDPMSETAALIHARAFRELGQNDQALAVLTVAESLPVYVEELQIVPAGESTSVRGQMIGNVAPPGTPIGLRFTFYDDNGMELGTQTVTVNAPADEVSTDFVVQIQQPATAYRYERAP